MKRRTKILIAALTNLTVISSAVLAEEGISIICEADKQTTDFRNDGNLSWIDKKIKKFVKYEIFSDRVSTGFKSEDDGREGCSIMRGEITKNRIFVTCVDSRLGKMTVNIDRSNGIWNSRQKPLRSPAERNYIEYIHEKGVCKKASGF